MGMTINQITKKAGRTVPAVRMGCQAGNRCLNSVTGLFIIDGPTGTAM